MSVISAAIIAGATAGVTGVASKAVSDLYDALKKLVQNSHSDVEFTEIEENPKSEETRKNLTKSVDLHSLEERPEFKDAAEKLIRKILDERVPIDSGALMIFKELKAKKGIILEDIDLDRRLIEAEKVETEGEFRASGIRDKRSASSVDQPAIKINELKSDSVKFILNTIYSIPRGVRIAIFALLAVGVVVLLFNLITGYVEDASKREKFNTKAKEIETSDFMSSVNYVLSVIPNNIRRTRDNDHWSRFSYSWGKHIGQLEESFKEVSDGLADDTMRAGTGADWVCGQTKNILESHYSILGRVGQITGIGINESNASGSILSVFGPEVRVPRAPKMEYIQTAICNGNLEQIKNPPDTRSEQEKDQDKMKSIDAFIAELEQLKSADPDAVLEAAQVDFLNTYISYLVSRGMRRADAIGEGKQALREVMSGGGYNYQIRGMNDIIDRIRQAERLKVRDIEAEIAALEFERQKLEK